MPSDLTVANTILQQLGGGRFRVMTGCHNFVGGDNFLRFSLPTDIQVKDNISTITITLDPSDTYTMKFERKVYRKLSTHIFETETVHEFHDVYCDMLQDIFETYTGLYTHL